MYAGDPPETWPDMPRASTPGSQQLNEITDKNNIDTADLGGESQVISGSNIDTTLGLLLQGWDEQQKLPDGSTIKATAFENQAPGYPPGWTCRVNVIQMVTILSIPLHAIPFLSGTNNLCPNKRGQKTWFLIPIIQNSDQISPTSRSR